MQIQDEILHRDPKPPRQIEAAVPAELERICLKCLAKDPTNRYLTAADLAKDLRRWVKPAPPRRGRGWLWAAAAIVAGLLSVAAWRVGMHGNGEADPKAAALHGKIDIRV